MTGFFFALTLFFSYKCFSSWYRKNKILKSRYVQILSDPMLPLITLKFSTRDMKILYLSCGIVEVGEFKAEKQMIYRSLPNGELYDKYDLKFESDDLLSEIFFVEVEDLKFHPLKLNAY